MSFDTAVIVPTLARPQNAAPFMESLRATTRRAKAYAICDRVDRDNITAWQKAGATVIYTIVSGSAGELTRPPGTFSEKVNLGYQQSDEPWLFITGDDVIFRRGWLANAKTVAGRDYHVTGTNDLGNPRVLAGQHAAHLLIRRSYVDERGASWDGPKVVCHEGYGHWFVDDEIVTCAKQRGVWAMALSSVVEHVHPMFGKASSDWVYERGRASYKADMELFDLRLGGEVGS